VRDPGELRDVGHDCRPATVGLADGGHEAVLVLDIRHGIGRSTAV
jgi:hypothetical protein